MIKTLTPIGNSLGLIIDRPILNLLNIERDTALEISTDGQTLIIRPADTKQTGSGKKTAAKTKQVTADENKPTSVRDAARSFIGEFKNALK
ncbi:MAG: hypothetical protein R8L58_04445 [Mariprofundaceae bacterium]